MKKSELICPNCKWGRDSLADARTYCVKNAPTALYVEGNNKNVPYIGIPVPDWFACGEGEWVEAKEQGKAEKKTVSHRVYHFQDYDAEEG